MPQSHIDRSQDNQNKTGVRLRPLKTYLIIFLAVKVLLLFFLARNSRFVMDEFQQGGMSFLIGKGFYESIFPVKT